jgi:hypothetical protein
MTDKERIAALRAALKETVTERGAHAFYVCNRSAKACRYQFNSLGSSKARRQGRNHR